MPLCPAFGLRVCSGASCEHLCGPRAAAGGNRGCREQDQRRTPWRVRGHTMYMGPKNSDPQPLHDHLEASPRPQGWTSQELAVTAHFSSPPNLGQPSLKSTPQDAWLVSPPTVSMEHRAPSFSSMTELPPARPAVGLCPTPGLPGLPGGQLCSLSFGFSLLIPPGVASCP